MWHILYSDCASSVVIITTSMQYKKQAPLPPPHFVFTIYHIHIEDYNILITEAPQTPPSSPPTQPSSLSIRTACSSATLRRQPAAATSCCCYFLKSVKILKIKVHKIVHKRGIISLFKKTKESLRIYVIVIIFWKYLNTFSWFLLLCFQFGMRSIAHIVQSTSVRRV